MQRITTFLLTVTALWLVLAAVPAQSQSSNILSLNVPVEGTLQPGEESIYLLPMRDGGMATLYVEGISGDLDPQLSIRNASGEEIIAHDDIDYPDNTNALVEAFSASMTGTYAVAVSGFGDTAGDYRITALPGYGEVLADDLLQSAADWQLTPITETGESGEFSVTNGAISVDVSGVDASVILPHSTIQVPDTYYMQVNVSDISGREGWQVGILFNHVDEQNYAMLNVDSGGLWRASYVANGERTIIRDWRSHPAIVAGTTNFSLGVFVKENDIEAFYDNQLIGSLHAEELPAGDSIGLSVSAANSVGASASVQFQDVIITEPITAATDMPPQLVYGDATVTIRELKRRSRIPSGGELNLTIPESSAQNLQDGVSRFNLARGQQYADFVMAAHVSWQSASDGVNGCGLAVRDSINDPIYGLVYVDNTGAVSITQRIDDAYEQTIFRDDLPISGTNHHLLVVALGTELHYYVNGHYVGTIQNELPAGGVSEAVVNYTPANTSCEYRNLWLWRWQ